MELLESLLGEDYVLRHLALVWIRGWAAGQYSGALSVLWAKRLVEQRAHGGEGFGRLERALQRIRHRAIELEPLHVPRVKAAQVAHGALLADVLDGAFDHPVELGQHLARARRLLARAQHLFKQPRVAEGPRASMTPAAPVCSKASRTASPPSARR